jgi:hypothetical protein
MVRQGNHAVSANNQVFHIYHLKSTFAEICHNIFAAYFLRCLFIMLFSTQ